MSLLGLAAAVAIFYWLGWFNWAFWVLAIAICGSVFATIRAVINPHWYIVGALMAGVDPNYKMLFVAKALSLAVLIPLAWYMGRLAGYF